MAAFKKDWIRLKSKSPELMVELNLAKSPNGFVQGRSGDGGLLPTCDFIDPARGRSTSSPYIIRFFHFTYQPGTTTSHPTTRVLGQL